MFFAFFCFLMMTLSGGPSQAYVIFRSAAGKPEDLSSAWQLVKLTTNAATPKHPFRSISDLGSPLMKILVPVVVAYGKSADWGEADDEALVLLSKHVCPRLSLRDRASLWGCNKSLHKFSSLCDSGRSRLREIANSTGPAFDIFEDVCLGNVGTGSQADSITRFMSSLTHALQEDWKLSHLNRYLREAFSAINVQGPCNEQEAAKEARRVFRSLRELAHEHIKARHIFVVEDARWLVPLSELSPLIPAAPCQVLEMRGGSQDVNRLLNALQLIGKRVKTPKFAPQQTRCAMRADEIGGLLPLTLSFSSPLPSFSHSCPVMQGIGTSLLQLFVLNGDSTAACVASREGVPKGARRAA